MATADVVGREPELAVVDAFLGTTVSTTPAALVLEGEAGIGKSTVWLAAVGAARDRGFVALSTRPTQAEHGLAYVALGDLLDTVLDDVLPALPPPRPAPGRAADTCRQVQFGRLHAWGRLGRGP